jgi:hypothetical protein
MLSSSVTISCTVVLMPSPGRLKSRTFLDLVISKAFISKWGAFNSILIGNLLALLHHRVSTDNRPPDDVIDLILGETRCSDIYIATTCVPSFGDDLENPLHGYRILAPCMSVDVGISLLPSPPASIVHDRELLSADVANPVMQSFLKLWGQMGVHCETHFFIIFFSPPTTLPSTIHYHHPSFSLNSLRSIALSSFLQSRDSPAYQAPPLSHENMDWEGLFSSNQASPHSHSIISQKDSPASGVAASITSHSHLSGSSGLPIGHLLHLPPSSSDGHDLFCQKFGITVIC